MSSGDAQANGSTAPPGLLHEQAVALLPWLANGTLDDVERPVVEAHVRGCVTCRAELKAQRALHDLVQRQSTVRLSAEEGFARLQGVLSEKGDARNVGVARRLAPTALAAALCAAAVGAAWIGWSLTSRTGVAPDYTTLTAPSASSVASVRIDVVFDPETTEPELRALLGELRATIVDGPTEIGRYTVRIPLGVPSELDAVLRRLREDPRVRFASRSFLPANSAETD
jgi:hypothetical protein